MEKPMTSSRTAENTAPLKKNRTFYDLKVQKREEVRRGEGEGNQLRGKRREREGNKRKEKGKEIKGEKKREG